MVGVLVATLAVLYAAIYVRMIRANVIEAMNEEYVRTARAKGASEWRVLGAHSCEPRCFRP